MNLGQFLFNFCKNFEFGLDCKTKLVQEVQTLLKVFGPGVNAIKSSIFVTLMKLQFLDQSHCFKTCYNCNFNNRSFQGLNSIL